MAWGIISAKSPTFAGPPIGRFCGEGARFSDITARSAEIKRNRHLIGVWVCVCVCVCVWGARNFAPPGSGFDCVESSENPEKSPRPTAPPPGHFCGEGDRFRETPTRPSEIRRNRHLLGAPWRNFVPHGSVIAFVESSGNPENLRGSRIRHPAGSSAKGRDPVTFPSDKPTCGEIAT